MDESAPGSDNEGSNDESMEDMPIEQQLEYEKRRVEECQEMVSNLVEQITGYRRIVEEEKEADKKKISGLMAQLDQLKKQNAMLQEKLESSSTVAADQALREKVKMLMAQLEAQRQQNDMLRADMKVNLQGVEKEMSA